MTRLFSILLFVLSLLWFRLIGLSCSRNQVQSCVIETLLSMIYQKTTSTALCLILSAGLLGCAPTGLTGSNSTGSESTESSSTVSPFVTAGSSLKNSSLKGSYHLSGSYNRIADHQENPLVTELLTDQNRLTDQSGSQQNLPLIAPPIVDENVSEASFLQDFNLSTDLIHDNP